jgi:spore germination cell wall hydrolase CwlJ-like protein
MRAIFLAVTLTVMAPIAHAADQRDCIARAIYWEARGLSDDGQRAVAEVVWNRVRHPAFPKTPCAVVYQRTGNVCQFSWVCTRSKNIRPPNNSAWQAAYRIAGEQPGNLTKGAIYFHAKRHRVRWRHLLEVAEIDSQVFYTHRR